MKNERPMTIGEFAKKMKVTVRTLQYYDKKGLLKPSEYSQGGRRLYTNKDIVQLHQILAMKYLGFSLDEIKNHIITLDTPQEIKKLLESQAEVIEKKISNLNEILITIRALCIEINEINDVDFSKYATIIDLIREKDENYALIKYFNNKVLDNIETRFTKESAKDFVRKLQEICERVKLLKAQNESPESRKGQEIAKEWWEHIQKFSGGDMSMINEMINLYQNNADWKNLLKQRNIVADEFIEKALFIYFKKKEEGEK